MTHHLLRNLLSQSGFIMLNKAMVKALGKDKALLLSFAIDKWAYNDGGNFYYTISDICDDIGICDKTARKILTELVEDGFLIKKEFAGLPPKQYYQIDGEALIDILSQPNMTSKEDSNIDVDIDREKTSYNSRNFSTHKNRKKKSDINKNTCTRTHDIKQYSFFMTQQVESKKTLVPPTSPQNDFLPESEIDVQAKTKNIPLKSENENPDKQENLNLPNIQIPNLERKKMTKQEKYVLGIQTYRYLKAECGDKLPLEESEWAEWVEHKVKTQPSKVTETSFKKQLKKAIGLDREYLLNQISKAISASWESPHFDKLSCDKFLNNKNSLLNSQKKTREYQLKHGVSGIAKYDFDDVEDGISEF